MPRPYHLEVARRHLQLRQPDAPVRQPLFQFCFAFVSADGWNIVRARLIVGHRTHAAPCRLPEVFGSANVAAVFRSCWVSFCHRHFIRPLPWALTPRSRRTLRMPAAPSRSRPSPRRSASCQSAMGRLLCQSGNALHNHHAYTMRNLRLVLATAYPCRLRFFCLLAPGTMHP